MIIARVLLMTQLAVIMDLMAAVKVAAHGAVKIYMMACLTK